MSRWIIVITGVVLSCLMIFPLQETAVSKASEVEPALDVVSDPLVIDLPRSIHFTAPDGGDVQLPPASYHIEQAGESSLRLVKDGAPPIEIQATRIPHDESISAPLRLAVMEEGQDEELHLLLLLPGGQALDATGSYSGMRSRGTFSSMLTTLQVQNAVSQVRVLPPPTQQQPSSQPIAPASTIVRVPQASVAASQDKENTGVVTVSVGPPQLVTWGYLRMHAMDQVVAALKDVQAGKRGAGVLDGLASPERIQQLLAVRYPDLAASGSVQPDVTSRGVNPSTAVTQQFTQTPLPSSPTQQFPAAGALGSSPGKAATAIQAHPTWTSLLSPAVKVTIDPRMKVPIMGDTFPKQLVLGSIYDGQTVRARVRIVAPRDGAVTVSFTKPRPFRIIEIHTTTGLLRRIATPAQFAPVVNQEPAQIRTQPPWTVTASSGQDLLVTVEFAPHFDLFSGDPVGRYDMTLDVNGDQWWAQVPVSGYFNGIRIGMIPALDAYQLDVLNPSAYGATTNCALPIPQGMTLTNADQQSHSVIIEPAGFPGQFSMTPVSITIGPNATQHVQLPIVLHCLVDSQSKEFELNLKLTYDVQKRATGFVLSVYPFMFRWDAGGTLGSCRYNSTFTVSPDGQFNLMVSADASSLGSRLFEYTFWLLGTPVAYLSVNPGGKFGGGDQKSYGFRSPGLAEHYNSLFDQKPDVRLQCSSKGPL